MTEFLGLVLRGSFSANWLPLATPQTLLSGGVAQLFSASELIEVGTGLTIAVFALIGMGMTGHRRARGAGTAEASGGRGGRAMILANYLAAVALFCIGLYARADQAEHDQDGDGPVADGDVHLPVHDLARLPGGVHRAGAAGPARREDRRGRSRTATWPTRCCRTSASPPLSSASR